MSLFNGDSTDAILRIQADILEIVQEVKLLQRTTQDLLGHTSRYKLNLKELFEESKVLSERLIKVEAQLELLTNNHVDIINISGNNDGDVNVVGKNQDRK